jgi:hypothetical protein
MCTVALAMTITSAITALANAGIAIAKAIDGDLSGAATSLGAAAGAAGAAYLSYQQIPSLSGSNMTSSEGNNLSGSGLGAELSDNLPSSSPPISINKSSNISFSPPQSNSDGLLGYNNQLSSTNTDMQQAITPNTMPMLQPQKQIATPSQIIDANKPDTSILGSIGNTIGGWIGIPNTDSLANSAGMNQSRAQQAPTTGGLLGALNSNAGLNLVNTIGGGLASMASAAEAKEAEQMKIDAAKNIQKDIRDNNSTAPISLGGKQWDAASSQWVTV